MCRMCIVCVSIERGVVLDSVEFGDNTHTNCLIK